MDAQANNKGTKNYFSKEIYALKLFGVSLIGNNSPYYKIYASVAIFGLTFMYITLDFVEYFKHDFDGIADIIIYQVAGVLSFCKVVVLLSNRVGLVKLLNKLQHAPFLPNAHRGGCKEAKLLEQCLWITTVQSYSYWIFSGTTVVGTIIYGIIRHMQNKTEHKLPYGPFTVLNTTYNTNYAITYCYQSVSIIYIASLYTSSDLLIANVLVHLCYQLKIMQNNIKRLIEISYKEMLKDGAAFNYHRTLNAGIPNNLDASIIPWKYLHTSLKEAIEYHLAIIYIATEMKKMLSVLFLILFQGTLAVLCFSVYSASTMNLQAVGRHLLEGICASMQVAAVCYWGEQVMHESQQVGRVVGELDFVGTDLRFQKMLVLVIRRSQTPIHLTVGKFSIVCLATFVWTLQKSYSSFMLLRTMNGNAV